MKKSFFLIGLACICLLFSCEEEQEIVQPCNDKNIPDAIKANADGVLILSDKEFNNMLKSASGNLVFEAERPPMYHIIGFCDYDAWCSAPYNGSGFMLYGPYTKEVPVGSRVSVSFLMKIDNNTINNDHVCTMDAISNYGGNVFRSINLNRKDLSTSFQRVGFMFSNTTGDNNLEFRINTVGNAKLWVDKVEVLWW